MKEKIENKEIWKYIIIIFCCVFAILICFSLRLVFLEIKNIKDSLPDEFAVSITKFEFKAGDIETVSDDCYELYFFLSPKTKKNYKYKSLDVYFNCYDANGKMIDEIFYVPIKLEDNDSGYFGGELIDSRGLIDKELSYCEFNYVN